MTGSPTRKGPRRLGTASIGFTVPQRAKYDAVSKIFRTPGYAVQTKFIEMSGRTLLRVVNEQEVQVDALQQLGVDDHSMVRINEQGDIELRRVDRWDVIGGMLGDFADRVRRETGLDWA